MKKRIYIPGIYIYILYVSSICGRQRAYRVEWSSSRHTPFVRPCHTNELNKKHQYQRYDPKPDLTPTPIAVHARIKVSTYLPEGTAVQRVSLGLLYNDLNRKHTYQRWAPCHNKDTTPNQNKVTAVVASVTRRKQISLPGQNNV